MVQAFAEKLRLAPDTLSKIKNGRLRLTERNAEIIERVFGRLLLYSPAGGT